MYIVRWLMGHPIIATWFLGAIAILLSISNSGDKKELDVDDHAANQKQLVTVDSTKSIDMPSAVTSALIESDEKKSTTEESEKAEVETVETESIESVKVEEPSEGIEDKETPANTVVSEAIVTEITVDSTVFTSRSYPDGLAADSGVPEVAIKTDVEVIDAPKTAETQSAKELEQAKGVAQTIEEAAGKTGNQTDVAVTATTTEVASIIKETPKSEGALAGTESIQDLGHSSTEEMLLMAREAYWNNGLEEASQIYTQLIELEPAVIEYRGELGNVYWRQGYPKKAAQLYSEIAIPMIEQGNAERVANMVGFIGLFYPEKAAEIYKKLQAAQH